MAPELLIPFISGSVSSVTWATTLMVSRLSRQRTERIKHRQSLELEREFLTLAMTAYEHALQDGQAPDLVDMTIALRNAMTRRGNRQAQSPPVRVAVQNDRSDAKR
jgi:hypothetical protein